MERKTSIRKNKVFLLKVVRIEIDKALPVEWVRERKSAF